MKKIIIFIILLLNFNIITCNAQSNYVTLDELYSILNKMKINQYNASDIYVQKVKYSIALSTENSYFSGNLIDNNTILTCAHFYKGDFDKYITCRDYKDNEFFGEVVSLDFKHDLALIKIDNNYDYTFNNNYINPNIGDEILTIGNALNHPFSLTSGTISNTDKDMFKTIQCDLFLNYGNSGGFVYDMKGNIVGLCQSKAENSNISFVASPSTIKEFLNNNHITTQ